jgi:16S rRNA (adenine1518-N6/adenine1519-N6)-dimethyltransferase
MQHPAGILKARGLAASRRRGQNFLTQPATALALAVSAGLALEDVVVEIGPGLGALTLPLAALAGRVIALEVDLGVHEALLAVLAQAGAVNVEARRQDALTFAWAAEAAAAGRRFKVVANLPYAIGSPLLLSLLESLGHWSSATLMVQREVAERLAAAPGRREYGRLSVLLQCWCKINLGVVVGPEQFFPRPQVESRVVHLTPRARPLADIAGLEQAVWYAQVVKAAFGQRRKTLLNSLTGGLGRPRAEVEEVLKGEGIDTSRRAETLDPQELGGVARALAGKSGRF